MEKKVKANRLGACQKNAWAPHLYDDQVNLLPFKGHDSVIFVLCKNCGFPFEANKKQAAEFIYVASIFAKSNKEPFPEHLLKENSSYAGYYLEVSKCKYCMGPEKKAEGRVKKIPT